MRTLLLALCLASSLSAQQECARRNDDGTLRTDTVTGGPNLLIGLRLVAEASYTISAAQVPTGLVAGTGTFAVWSHDAANDRPLANLSGDGVYQQIAPVVWQGAALPTPVALTTGQVFWLVWGMPNSSRTPLATSTTHPVPYRGSLNGGATWNGQNNGASPWPPQPYKLRLFCTYATNPVVAVGNGKSGAFGVPLQHVIGWAAQRNELAFALTSAAPAAPAVLALGTPFFLPLPGVAELYVNPLLTIPVTTSGTPGRSPGAASMAFRVPFGAAGFPLATQWFVVDSSSVGGLSHTDGAQVVIL